MNKFMYIFPVLFVVILAVVWCADPGAPITDPRETTRWETVSTGESTGASGEESRIPEETAEETHPEGAEDWFMPVADSRNHNKELQIYMPQQVEFSENEILMKADKLGEGFVSGKAESRMAVRYGSFSFRIHTVEGAGLFPAIWLLPAGDNGGFPEIDIYELVGSLPGEFWCVRHYKTEDGKKNDNFRYRFPKDQVPESYVLRFEWTQEKLTWYLEDEEIFSIQEEVPDMPMYMILNFAVGGYWPGAPTADTNFPAGFRVEVLEFAPAETFPRY